MIEVKKLDEIFSQINEYWQPHIVGELNGQHVKAAKFKGQFPMHKHDYEDEMFLVIKGEIHIEFTDYTKTIGEGEFIVIPKGIEHSPIASEESHVLLFEPMSTLNTGNTENEYTHRDLKKL
ncbi:MAG: cupin domain-containing protein [Candidatus Kapaibacterium sp.]|jgi:mannose-6-phosphate isomerase-like protein (cupin superfamily)